MGVEEEEAKQVEGGQDDGIASGVGRES